MNSFRRKPPRLPVIGLARFLGLFFALYVAAASVAEVRVGREAGGSAFQKILTAKDGQFDWIVLGASHALPLAFGDVAKRLEDETGQRMIVLAEVGAGPLFSDFVLLQAIEDLRPRRLLYIADSFAFQSSRWNEERIADRKLLRKTPLRLSTLVTMSNLVISQDVPASALLDYATVFSKLNPPDRFPQDDWRGAEHFDRVFRPSRHATKARIDYLYPEPVDDTKLDRYLDTLEGMIARARVAGMEVAIVRPPVPEAFRESLPGEAAFDAKLRARLSGLDVPLHDLSATLDDPALYFDTDHLNRDGVELLYELHLKSILAVDR